MKFCTHLSRKQVVEVTAPPGAALVSIMSPGTGPAEIYLPAWEDVLRVEFDDVPDDTSEYWAAGYIPPQPEHAREIARFIEKHRGRSIVAHCQAGISRSAAVCAALVAHGWKYIRPHDEGLRNANPLLAALLLRELAPRMKRAGAGNRHHPDPDRLPPHGAENEAVPFPGGR